MAALLAVDRRSEQFGAAVTIADLALHSFPDHDGDGVTIYEVWDVLERDWSFELDRDACEAEYAIGVTARFLDGSVLRIAARRLLRRVGLPALSRLLIFSLGKAVQP